VRAATRQAPTNSNIGNRGTSGITASHFQGSEAVRSQAPAATAATSPAPRSFANHLPANPLPTSEPRTTTAYATPIGAPAQISGATRSPSGSDGSE
jgi:hypothetical protein